MEPHTGRSELMKPSGLETSGHGTVLIFTTGGPEEHLCDKTFKHDVILLKHFVTYIFTAYCPSCLIQSHPDRCHRTGAANQALPVPGTQVNEHVCVGGAGAQPATFLQRLMLGDFAHLCRNPALTQLLTSRQVVFTGKQSRKCIKLIIQRKTSI